jgi:glycosyltransferase involved in cell wall biosynthesis
MANSSPGLRVHLPALVHRDCNPDWEPDAYVGKIWRLARILAELGHEVFVYGGPDTDTAGTDVTVVSDDDRLRWFGSETWENRVFNEFDPLSAPWVTFNSRTVTAIGERIESGDVIFLTMGTAQAAIQQAFPAHVVAECGVGYEGVLHNTHRCYESEAWRHYIYGRTGAFDGRWFDTVIPNAYDPADYIYRPDHDGYLLFMGRHTPRKGLEVVADLAKRHRVITAGQGGPIDGAEYAGVVRGKEKAELLAGARAVLCPTQYIEPFGGVAAEAMLSGTPVISSPFGAFSETVADGLSGFRCHTLGQFIRAADALDDLDRKTVQEWAADRFTLEAVAPQYDRWLRRLATLYGDGWYQ